MSLSAEVYFSIVAVETDTADIARNNRVTKAEYFKALADGTEANQAQIVWSDSRTTSGTDTLQLSNLTDTRDGAGVSVIFSAVKAIYVRNTGSTHTLTLSGAFAGSVAPGGVFVVVNPSAAGASASTLFVSGTSGATYDIVVVGEGTII